MKIEKIMCSAIWVKDENIICVHYPTNISYGLIVLGYRHHNCVEHIGNLYERERLLQIENIQGFLTTNNRFVNRIEAKQIAIAANQLLENCSNKKELFSEDVWLINE